MRPRNLVWGFLFIIFGVLLMLNNFFDIEFFSMHYFWPIFVLVPGLIFEVTYYMTGKDPGILVPGGILTTIGILFFFETFTNWYFSAYTWPVYPLAVAIGLFQLYLFGGRKWGLLVPIGILTAVSAISFASMVLGTLFNWINFSFIFPIILILLGIVILFKNIRN